MTLGQPLMLQGWIFRENTFVEGFLIRNGAQNTQKKKSSDPFRT
jgi:hypothetical protein